MISQWRPEPLGGPLQLPPGNCPSPIVLKDGPLFLVQPQLSQGPAPEAGLFFRDTRFLDGLQWWVEDQSPMVLSTALYDMNRAQIDMANPEMVAQGALVSPHTLHFRLTLLMGDRLYARLRVVNFSQMTVTVHLRLRLSADFKDIFEIRGVLDRTRRGLTHIPVAQGSQAEFSYDGLDGITRSTQVRADPAPDAWQVRPDGGVEGLYTLRLDPRAKIYRYLAVHPILGAAPPPQAPPERLSQRLTFAALGAARAARGWMERSTRFDTDNAQYNTLLLQASQDMRALMTEYPHGRIIDAGIPWYVAPFGRDAAITGIETLLLNPDIAKDSLRFLAHFQATESSDWRDEEPGKILHEMRQGELAGAGEIPHTPYYGSVDSTLWWVIAVYETWTYTADQPFLEALGAHLEKAVRWILDYGDADGDSFVEYMRRSRLGLDNQGWKDSFDSAQDSAGATLKGPIALVEVQGYAFYALTHGAEMLRHLHRTAAAHRAEEGARRLQERFGQNFVSNDGRRIAYALDGLKRPVWTQTSNQGHLLFTGILPPDRARTLTDQLMRGDMLSGFGVRTLSRKMPFYNPMSYHNGSVWPHDNAIIAWGMRVQGALPELLTLSAQLYRAARSFPQGRLPELYCGFAPRAGAGPVNYPVACSPQAWAAAAPFMLMRMWLGITVTGHEVRIVEPELPPWIHELYLDHLAIAGGVLSLEFARSRGVTYASVVRREGLVHVVIVPQRG